MPGRAANLKQEAILDAVTRARVRLWNAVSVEEPKGLPVQADAIFALVYKAE